MCARVSIVLAEGHACSTRSWRSTALNLIACVCATVCMCVQQKTFSQVTPRIGIKFVSVKRYVPGIGPTATGILLCSAWTEQRLPKHTTPQKNLFDFQFPFASVWRMPFGAWMRLGKQKIYCTMLNRANGQGRRLSEPAITAFFLDWALAKSAAGSPCIVHCSCAY